ncbi:hypothetical protein PIB30_067716 [Stylosanthes scabra]|uniref:Uncharacterized protein n=1 Tax=Stylosanthes scabra TaxID=79078 RepID=A0ABU6RML7_9FABA|nr:hypothetical protein [Stylosanthes scabra]
MPGSYNWYQSNRSGSSMVGSQLILVLPKFSGKDVDGWVTQAEHYFKVAQVRITDRVGVALAAMDGEASTWSQCSPFLDLRSEDRSEHEGSGRRG